MSASTRKATSSYIRPYAAQIASIAILQAIGAVMQVLAIGMLQPILDVANAGYGNEYILSNGLFLLGLTIVYALSVALASGMSSRVAARVASDIRRDVLEATLRSQNLGAAGDTTTFTLTCLTSDAMSIQAQVYMMFSLYLPVPMVILTMVYSTCLISLSIGAMLIASMLLVTALTYVLSRRASKFQANRTKGQDLVTRSLREKIVGSRTIRAYSGRDHENAKFEFISRFLGLNTKNVVMSSYYLPIFTTAFVWIFIVFVYMIAALDASSSTVEPSHLMIFMQFTACMVAALAVIPIICIQTPQARASMERILAVLGSVEPERPRSERREDGYALRVEGASLEDEYGRMTMKGLYLEIPRGRVVTLTGMNGCGINELMDVITAFRVPTAGTVTVCGMDVAASDPSDIRRAISYAGRQSGVFHSSIRTNLDAEHVHDDDEILEVCRRTGFIDYVEGLQGGLDAVVSSSFMSGGQAQLLALTRCLLRDAEMYVFDDCFFSMDDRALSKAVGAILGSCSGRTVLFASHGMTTVNVSDEVFLIQNGRVADSGTHEALLERSAAYQEMFSKRPRTISC